MRLHDRLPALALAAGIALAAGAGAGAVSCQSLSGSGKGAAEFTQHRQQLSESRSALNSAIGEGDLSRVRSILPSISGSFDVVEARSSGMNLLDRQHLAIQIATGRRTITQANRWVEAVDVEAVRNEIRQLDGILGEIDTLLERAIRGSTDKPPSGS